MPTLDLNETHATSAAAKNAALWILQLGAAAMFLSASFGKLTGNPQMIAAFDLIGFGQWFRYFTGGIELVGALFLLVPSMAGVGALLLIPTMVGAVLAHLIILGGSANPAIALLVAASFIAYGRWSRTLDLLVA